MQHLLMKVSDMAPALTGICNLTKEMDIKEKYLEIYATIY